MKTANAKLLNALNDKSLAMPYAAIKHILGEAEATILNQEIEIESLRSKLAEQPTPSQSDDKTCEINSVSSRVCEKGSKSCAVYHDKPQPTSQDVIDAELIDAIREVIRISDRDHLAWYKVKSFLNAAPKG